MQRPTLTRDQVTGLYQCSHSELGRLLRDKVAPLPVRIDGAILWYKDECEDTAVRTRIASLLQRRRQPRAA